MEAILRQHGSFDRWHLDTSDRIGVLQDVLAALAPKSAGDIEFVRQSILPEFNAYGELIAAVDSPVAGLLVRGEGEEFTRRVSVLMDAWDMTDEAMRFHRTLAEAFSHKRIFLKLEWIEGDHGLERQIAVYYRRRPYVHDALKILASFAGRCLPLDDFRELATLLGKESVHFVAFTARPNRPLWYKFYFSQYLIPPGYAAAETRLERAVERFASGSSCTSRWATYRDRLAPRYRPQTIFVSLAMSEDAGDGSLKIDYPDVPASVAAGLLDGAAALAAEERFRWLCQAAGRETLSYLGVRIGAQEHVVLKGYADFV